MHKKRTALLTGVCILLTACGQSDGETAVGIAGTAKAYETISYQEYKEQTGKEAEFYHATRFMGEIADSSIGVIFEGTYDEETAGAVLADDAVPIRLQGPLGALMDGIGESMSLAELADALSVDGAVEAVFERLEGAGTAYYVGNDYVQIQFDSDRDGKYDRRLLISMDEAAEETVGQESDAWLEML